MPSLYVDQMVESGIWTATAEVIEDNYDNPGDAAAAALVAAGLSIPQSDAVQDPTEVALVVAGFSTNQAEAILT